VEIVEGYFLKYKGGIWAVKGCYHPNGWVVAMPRVIGGRKLKTIKESIEAAKQITVVRYIEEIGREVPLVPLKYAEILDPFRWKPGDSEICRKTNRMLDYLPGAGVTGSLLYDGDGKDIDLLTFNPRHYSILKEMRQNGITEPLDKVEFEDVEVLGIEDMRTLKARRLLEGKFQKVPYTFKIVNCEEWEPVTNKKNFSGTVKLVSGNGISLPVKYSGELEDGTNVKLTSFRIRFTELPKGTILQVKGYLLERNFLDLNLDLAEEIRIVKLPETTIERDDS